MVRAAFARHTRVTEYGYDSLLNFGHLADGSVLRAAADRVLSAKTVWVQSSAPLSVETGTRTPAYVSEFAYELSKILNLARGQLRIDPGAAAIYAYEAVDTEAAWAECLARCIVDVSGSQVSADQLGRMIATVLGRPSGAYRSGISLVDVDGTTLKQGGMERLICVALRDKVDKSTTEITLDEEVAQTILSATTITELTTTAGPLLTQKIESEQFVADLVEVEDDLPAIPGFLPSDGPGVTVPFPMTAAGLTAATEFASAVPSILPGTQVNVTRTREREWV